MYSLAREHMTSKLELVKVGALRQVMSCRQYMRCRLYSGNVRWGPKRALLSLQTSMSDSTLSGGAHLLFPCAHLPQLSQLLSHESKQCRLNATATLYAVSCAGRAACRELLENNPIPALKASVTPMIGRTSQDEQLQLFAALLIVNLLHVRGAAKTKQEIFV